MSVKNSVLLLLSAGALLAGQPAAVRAQTAAQPPSFCGASPLEWSVRLADSEMLRRGDKLAWKATGGGKWDYTAGLFTLSLLKLNTYANYPRYQQFSERAIGSFIGTDGSIQGYRLSEYQLDALNPGKTVLALYETTHEERYHKAATLLCKQLESQPRTPEGGFWHKQRYTNQMWLDGIYMASPFYAQYATMFGQPAGALDDVVKQIQLIDKHTFDPASGLHYHGWDAAKAQTWANAETGTSSNFWGRAEGWYAMALVDVLDYLPANHPGRPQLIAILQKVSAGILSHQDAASGLWYQVLDQGNRKGNYLEATASAMFVYSLAKGVNQGYLSRESVPALLKGYEGMIKHLVSTNEQGLVSLAQCCSVAGLGFGRDGSFDYYIKEPVISNDLKGVGPFVLAGIEMQKLLGLALSVPAAAHIDSGAVPSAGAKGGASAEWDQVPAILARIQAPSFPAREFPITDYGAAADGKTDCTEALARAIDACAKAGGGHVVVPAGEYFTGPIVLKSHVDLHLDGGATLKFKTTPAAYLPAVLTRFEGMECYNYAPLIYAYGQENVAVTGEGLLDGQADTEHWWFWKGNSQGGWKAGEPTQKAARDRLDKMVNENTPVEQRRFGEGDYLRPSFIEPYLCRNVLIEGVRIRRSPMWELHPTLCTNVIVRGVDIFSHGPNNDGCDPECCRDVLIEDCIFDTGDDCIAIKSGRNNDGRRIGLASENLVIRRCTMKDGHGGVVVGSEISGGCRNVFAEDCQMDSPNLERVLRLKSNAMRGGVLENIFLRNISVGQVADAVLQIDFMYEEGPNGAFKPAVRNVLMQNVRVRHTPRVLNVTGFAGAEIRAVHLEHCTFEQVRQPDVVKDAGEIKLSDCVIEKAGSSSAAADPKAGDWQSLFDGRKLDAWVPVNEGQFAVTNGVIHVTGGSGWMRSVRLYTNFVFEADWRALETNYNSGFLLRAVLEGKPFPTNGWQVNLKASALGELLVGPKRVLPPPVPAVAIGQWSHFSMLAQGHTLTLDIDGKRAWVMTNFPPQSGYLGIQAEKKTFEFRNLRVKELPAEPQTAER